MGYLTLNYLVLAVMLVLLVVVVVVFVLAKKSSLNPSIPVYNHSDNEQDGLGWREIINTPSQSTDTSAILMIPQAEELLYGAMVAGDMEHGHKTPDHSHSHQAPQSHKSDDNETRSNTVTTTMYSSRSSSSDNNSNYSSSDNSSYSSSSDSSSCSSSSVDC